MTEDRSNSRNIEQLLEQAAEGDKAALSEVCQRFRVPIFAAALNVGATWEDAAEVVGPTLRSLATQLLDGQLSPCDWKEQLLLQTQTMARMSADPHETLDAGQRSGLSGMSAIPRLAKRRAARRALLQLPLPQLTAVLLKQIDGIGAADMSGVVAESEAEVVSELVTANETISEAILAADSDSTVNPHEE